MTPNGMIMHAELQLGTSRIMVAEAMMNPPTQSSLHLYVEDCDALWARATAAGCKIEMPIATMFWGDRYGVVSDKFGNRWAIASHKEDVAPDEMKRRMPSLEDELPVATGAPGPNQVGFAHGRPVSADRARCTQRGDSVAAGAFGAHGLSEASTPARSRSSRPARATTCITRSRCPAGMIATRGATTAGWMFQVGIVVFSGSLYALALTGVKGLGAITPLGGLAFIVGWIWLAWTAYAADSSRQSPARDRELEARGLIVSLIRSIVSVATWCNPRRRPRPEDSLTASAAISATSIVGGGVGWTRGRRARRPRAAA